MTPRDDGGKRTFHASDEPAGRWCDDPSAELDVAGLPPEERRRLADLQVLHGLLESAAESAEAQEARIERVLQGVRTAAQPHSSTMARPRPVPGARQRLRWWLSTVATVAAVVLFVAWIRWQAPPANAQAEVKRAFDQLHTHDARLYNVLIVRQTAPDEIVSREAVLYVQGSNRFAFRYPETNDRLWWAGSDGSQSWIVPPAGPVTVSSDPGMIQRRFRGIENSMPFLSFAAVLVEMQDRYRLELLGSGRLEGSATLWRHVRGSLREAAVAGPHRIDLWTDPETGLIGAMELAWPEGSSARGFERIELRLVPGKRPAPDLFRHAQHHGPDRAVLGESLLPDLP